MSEQDSGYQDQDAKNAALLLPKDLNQSAEQIENAREQQTFQNPKAVQMASNNMPSMATSALGPAPTPQASAQVSPSGTTDPRATDRQNTQAALAEAAALNTELGKRQGDIDTLAATAAKDRIPNQKYQTDDKGNVVFQNGKPQLKLEYQLTTGQKILRGLAAAGVGYLHGGPGRAIEGAIAPQTALGKDRGYNDPNKVYTVGEQQRQMKVGGEEASLAEQRKSFQDAAKRAQDIRAQVTAATAGQRVDEQARRNDEQSRHNTTMETIAQNKQDNKEPQTVDEISLARANAAASGDTAKVKVYDAALNTIKQLKLAGKDTSAADLAKVLQTERFRQTETDKVNNAKEGERKNRYAELEKNVVLKYNADKLAAAKAGVDSELDIKYNPRMEDVNQRADGMLGMTKQGSKLKSGKTNPPVAPTMAPSHGQPASPQTAPATLGAPPAAPAKTNTANSQLPVGAPVTVDGKPYVVTGYNAKTGKPTVRPAGNTAVQ